MRPKILISLSVSILSAIFITAAPSRAPAIRENNLAATQFKPSVDKFAVRSSSVNLKALSQELSPNTFLSASTLALSPALHISVGQEQRALVLLGIAFLLGGILWLKKARRAEERPAANNTPLEPLVVLPKMATECIEVELVTKSTSSESCNEAQISA